MIARGLVAAGCALISGPGSFYSIRFLLGLTEAGFFPGVAFLLSQWFPAEYRARMPAILLLALIQFGFTTGSYGAGIWLPQIIKAHFHSNLTVGFVSAGPYLVASIAMPVWAAGSIAAATGLAIRS